MVLTINAPAMTETISNLTISSSGTAIPYTKAFTAIKSVQATLQVNGSGGVTVDVDKSDPLRPVIWAYNAGASTHVRGYG
jgi:hypothetical protein